MVQGYPTGQQIARPQNRVVRCDCSYFKTPSGILKIVQVLSSLICFICAEEISFIGNCPGCLEWFRTATVTGVIFSFVLLVFYLFHFVEKFDRFPWRVVDLLICLLWTIFNLSVFWRNTTIYGTDSASSALFNSISIFSFVSMVAYGCDAVLKLIRIVRQQPAQG